MKSGNSAESFERSPNKDLLEEIAQGPRDRMANEQDSYRYEVLFLDNLGTLLPDAESIALHRRSQFVGRRLNFLLDVIGMTLAHSFHCGSPVEDLTSELRRVAASVDISFKPIDAYDFMRFSPLADPLRQVAYVDAFVDQYLPHAKRFLYI